MGLGPGKMDLILFGWGRELCPLRKLLKLQAEGLQLLLNILHLVAETMDTFISFWVWRRILFDMDAHGAGGIHAFVLRAHCLQTVSCTVACLQGTSCWCNLPACMVQTHSLAHSQLRFCLGHVLSWCWITWDITVANPRVWELSWVCGEGFSS